MARGLLIWLIIMLAETGHGVLRGLFLVPLIGEAAAARAGWPVAAVLVMAIGLMTIGWTGLGGTAGLLWLGTAWAVLTIAFEIVIGLLRGFDGPALLAALNPLTGSIAWSAALMFADPLLAARIRTWARG